MDKINTKILIVEDESSISDALDTKFKMEGFDAIVAKDGVAGLISAEKEKPDIILLDIIMPKMDGITMLKELRTKEWGKNIPVIILTNLLDDQKIAESMQQGTFDYLIKSNWRIDDLVNRIKDKLKI